MVENFDDVSKEEEEDVKPQIACENARVNKKYGKAKARKKNRVAKRKRFEESIEKIEKKIEDVANRTDQRVGHIIMDVITKFKVCETIRDIKMENLMVKVEELKQLC